MSQAIANFPSSVWEGDSASRSDPTLVERHPSWQDWDQAVAEIIALQNASFAPTLKGSVPAITGVSAVANSKVGTVNVTTITLTAVAVNTTDDMTHGAFGGTEIFDFPEGNILVLGATASIALLAGSGGLADTAAIVLGVGTAAAAQSAGDGTLATTENNIIPSTAFTLSGGAKVATAAVSTGVKAIDGHASAGKAYLNAQCPTAGSSAADTLTFTGTVKITWVDLGDA